jgi:hypothetical protein
MKSHNPKLVILGLVLLAGFAVLAGGCASGSTSAHVYGSYGYYGGYYGPSGPYYHGDVIVGGPPPVGVAPQPPPSRPQRPPQASQLPSRPLPSPAPRPAPRAAPRGGGGRR